MAETHQKFAANLIGTKDKPASDGAVNKATPIAAKPADKETKPKPPAASVPPTSNGNAKKVLHRCRENRRCLS